MVKCQLNEIAQRLGKTATEIAQETGINRNTVTTLMKDRVSGMRFSTLEKLCRTYGLQLSDVLLLDESPSIKSKREKVLPSKPYKQEAGLVPFTCWPWALVPTFFKLRSNSEEISFGPLVIHFQSDYGVAYWDVDSMRSVAQAVYQRLADPREFKKSYRRFESQAIQIEESFDQSHDWQAEEMSVAETTSRFEQLRGLYRSYWEESLFIDMFDTGVDVEEINKIAKRHGFSGAEVIALTTPPEMTFADERKLALLRLAKKVLRGDVTDAVVMKERLQKHMQVVEGYRRSFDYYKSNYSHVKHMSIQEVSEEIMSYMHNKELLQKEFDRMSNYHKEHDREREKILREHRLKEDPLWFFNSLTFWREERKRVNLMGIHVLEVILSAVEAHTGIAKKYLKYLSFDEVDQVLRGLISASTLKHRRESGMLVMIEEGGYQVIEGDEADSVRQDLESLLLKKSERGQVISGQTASQGHAKGVARVIMKHEQFQDFRKGEVLVTSMTRPEFLPLMKKAAAIVTNEGGITSHAAIVSRELGKPCVIGTKNATELINDGDLVEVRGNHGTVRIMKENEGKS